MRPLRLGEEKRKKIEEDRNYRMKIYMVSLLHRATIKYCCVAKRCEVDSRDEHLTSVRAHCTQENQEPLQNNDGSGEIGLSVSTLH